LPLQSPQLGVLAVRAATAVPVIVRLADVVEGGLVVVVVPVVGGLVAVEVPVAPAGPVAEPGAPVEAGPPDPGWPPGAGPPGGRGRPESPAGSCGPVTATAPPVAEPCAFRPTRRAVPTMAPSSPSMIRRMRVSLRPTGQNGSRWIWRLGTLSRRRM